MRQCSAMEKLWLENYPVGVPRRLELDAEESLVDLFETACRRFSALPAFTNFGQTLSYAEMDDLTARFAAWLQTRAGLNSGDRVAIMMPNLLQYPVVLFGALRAGMVVVNVNPLYTARELRHQLKDSGARVVIVVDMSAATVAEVVGETDVEKVVVTGVGDLLGFPRRQLVNFAVRYIKKMVPNFDRSFVHFDATLNVSAQLFSPLSLTGRDLAILQYTGGTTGRAKGAMLSHGNLVANVRQINAWFGSLLEDGKEIVVTALPLYHVYALTCNCLCYVERGARNLLITDPRDTKGFIRELRKWKFTAITGVNTLYQSMVDHPDFVKIDFSALKMVSAGGMAVMEFTAREWSRLTGTEILEGYGLSETSPVVCTNLPSLDAYNGSIGLPLPNTEISLRDNHGREVPLGESGELCVRGPQVMAGYWNNPEATAAVMTDDGFLSTGDIATMDGDGFFRIVDRKKDMILVSGFNVYPNEIENVATMHPDIVEAACIGVPHGQEGDELVKLFVVLRPGAQLTVEEIRAYCRENLTAYKVPKLVEFRSELPKSNVGKILRRTLREEE
jgi:long-chain acyl-CoA synthetase